MNVSDFDFHLPEELIAQEPPQERGGSRLLVLDRAAGQLDHTVFTAIGGYLRRGDLLVLNDTRVFPARLLGHRFPSGGAVECLLVQELRTPAPAPDRLSKAGVEGLEAGEAKSSGVGRPELWEALMHPGQKLKPGARVRFEHDGIVIDGEVLERRFFGRRTVRLWCDQMDVAAAVDRIGHIPLPPYIKRADRPADRDRYQTVYAGERGSIAAPTAGLHFTEPLLAQLSAAGIEQTRVTLHVGYGTFKPVRVERVEDHQVDAERCAVGAAAAVALTRAQREGRRVIAVGTTTTRVLESLDIDAQGNVQPFSGETATFIHPGHRFRIVNGLVTNFHLPKSSLLMLVAAFGGYERVMAAYRAAVEQRYRFYSYGDAMLIL